MKHVTLTICAAAILLFSCNNAEEKKDDGAKTDTTASKMTDAGAAPEKPAPPMDSAAMMKAWTDFATPGPEHKWLEKFNGIWEAQLDQWMAPGAPPTKTKGSCTQTPMLGGRYFSVKYTSTMMGQPFDGMSVMGYDNAKKKFVSTWIDNMGTGIVIMTGTYDETTKTLNMKGTQSDPVSGKDTDIREELRVIDDNSYVQTMYGAGPDGKEMKFMEGTFTKKK